MKQAYKYKLLTVSYQKNIKTIRRTVTSLDEPDRYKAEDEKYA